LPVTTTPIRNALYDVNPFVALHEKPFRMIIFAHKKMDRIEKVKKTIGQHLSTIRIACSVEKQEKPLVKGLHIITVESPDELENSMGKFLNDMKKFLLSQK
jgi:hypothetical protein